MDPICAHFQGEWSCTCGFRACHSLCWMNSPAVLREQLQALQHPWEGWKHHQGIGLELELHLSLDHLKMPWSCANRVLVPVGGNFLGRGDEVLTSPENEKLHQGMMNSDHCKKTKGDFQGSFPVLFQLLTPCSQWTFVQLQEDILTLGDATEQRSSPVQPSSAPTRMKVENLWHCCHLLCLWHLLLCWWEPPLNVPSAGAWLSATLQLEQSQLCSAQSFLEK